jgi:hypothetical protein
MGVVGNVTITAVGPGAAAVRTNLLLDGSSRSPSGNPDNDSVSRLDVRSMTIHESLAKHAMHDGSDGGDSLNINSNSDIDIEEEDQTCSTL